MAMEFSPDAKFCQQTDIFHRHYLGGWEIGRIFFKIINALKIKATWHAKCLRKSNPTSGYTR